MNTVIVFCEALRKKADDKGVKYIEVDNLEIKDYLHLDLDFVGIDYNFIGDSVIFAWRDELAQAVNSFKAKKENERLKKEGPTESSSSDHGDV